MRSRFLILLILGTLLMPLSAQEAPSLASGAYADFEKGDGIFSLTLGTSVPLGFAGGDGYLAPNAYPGFAFSLSYLGFLDENWMVGGEIGGSFITTIADRRLFIAPIAARVAYAIDLSPFVIAPGAGLGMGVSALGEATHVDPLIKLGSSFYWRVNADMSYGLNLFGNVIPQFYRDSSQDMTGFFLEATLSVAYHL